MRPRCDIGCDVAFPMTATACRGLPGGLGASHGADAHGYTAVGGDAGVIVSLGKQSVDTNVYGALRASLAVPAKHNVYSDFGIVVGFVAMPIGIQHHLAPAWDFVAEV